MVRMRCVAARWMMAAACLALPVSCLRAQVAAVAPAVAERGAELARVFHDYREDYLRHHPEFASSIGDRRYNDQLSDLSPREVNAELERGRGFLARLGMIDTAGLPESERASAELLERTLIENEQHAQRKEWEMPVHSSYGIQTALPELANHIPLATVKDYDDFVTRLTKIPDQIRQATTNMQTGIDEGRVQPFVLDKVMAQVRAIATAKPEASAFAEPLKKFPASIPAAARQRIAQDMLAAIQDDVQPAFGRFARFLAAQAAAGAKFEAAGSQDTTPEQPENAWIMSQIAAQR
jgi:uncharacterized protein (DUF885 family)